MRLLFPVWVAALHITASLGAPIDLTVIAGRSEKTSSLIELQNKVTAKATKAPTAAQVKTAGDNFASDVAIVSSSLTSLGTTTDTATRTKLANTAFKAETDEDTQRAVLFAAGKNSDANSKIVANTPIVLNGLSAIAKNPSDANTMKMLSTIEAARNPNILPSITALTKSAFQATNVQSTAASFKATNGTQLFKKLIASGNSATSTTTANAAKGTTTATAKASTAGAKKTDN